MELKTGNLGFGENNNIDIKIRKILLATDGSIPAIEATQYAVALAKIMGARIKAIFVDSSGEKEIRPSAAGLAVAQLYAEENGIICETNIVNGQVAKTIIETAHDYGADLIIVGNTGRTGIRRLSMGSVAEAVVKNSQIPVLVLKGS
ncbi:MAG: universal stress protein [Firmicutes bacterium]|nr:universal stress protein [Bacillota bacterium]